MFGPLDRITLLAGPQCHRRGLVRRGQDPLGFVHLELHGQSHPEPDVKAPRLDGNSVSAGPLRAAACLRFRDHRVQDNALYPATVSYTHLRAHETDSYLVCRLLLEKKKKK